MALHESVLEEFGLAPLWVRRGMAVVASAEAVELASDAQTSHARPGEAGAADAGARREEPLAADPGVTAPSTSPAGRAERDDRQPGSQQATARSHDEQRPAMRASEAPQSRQTQPGSGQSASMRTSEPRQPAPAREPDEHRSPAQRSEPARQTPPSSFGEAPSDDDFAWFDDLPAHESGPASAEPRRETPEALPIHLLDWDALSDRVAGCERCRLCEKRTKTVFGVGDRNADWMLIGEAPGENEDRLGEPFVGQAGKLLDNMLRALTLARDTNVYIANVIKCRPPGNRNPEPDEVARCEPYLQRQVALVKPKLIVALGRFAAQSLLKTDASISSLRGRVHEYEGVPVIVTYHPAYLLRSLPDKAKAWADLCLAHDTWRKAGGTASHEAK
ncbi:uracil-DNA glycosylase family protein [Paraburkholderia lacunae]|uniref:Type-4 uracil-DNA glycosylase n=1 Tax=Paraburkholderia lacunae TaxID=2211104 RepID=A0A370NAG0_9BURK|nr:uracil-DNA glycosylase family protein [Paraburkholderia lacunae]RDK02545.1 uracil-DNA glycosylase [Paraburkholderia lacunae]